MERQWFYDGQLRPVAELNASGTVTATYIYATHINVPDYIVKSGITYRVITDHLGSLRFIINTSNGTIAQRIDYDDWGNVLLNTAPDWTPFGFAGGIYDKDTKLTRFGARDYDAESGRWATKDKSAFAGGETNFYNYCLSDTINLIDPIGYVNLTVTTFEFPYNGVSLWKHGYTVPSLAIFKKCCESGGNYQLNFDAFLSMSVYSDSAKTLMHERKHANIAINYYSGLINSTLAPYEKVKYGSEEECIAAGEAAINETFDRINEFNLKFWWEEAWIDLREGQISGLLSYGYVRRSK